MKNRKRWLSLVLCFATLVSFNIQTFAASGQDSLPYITEAEVNRIFTEFADEISYVEDKYGKSITDLNEESLDLISCEAVLNLSNDEFQFGDLMDEIALAYQDAELRTMFKGRNGDYNASSETIISFRPLKGKYITEVATGVTETASDSTNISIGVGEELGGGEGVFAGITLDVGVTKSVSYSVTGPTDGAKLYNGELATHRIAFGALYGSIIKTEFDDPRVGHRVFYKIGTGARAQSFTVLASMGRPTYVNQAREEVTKYFSNQNDMEDTVVIDPNMFIGEEYD